MLQERRRAHIPSTKVVSSVVGDAMYMKWLDEIGLGSWEWESPTPERAIQSQALTVLTGHAIVCPLASGSG